MSHISDGPWNDPSYSPVDNIDSAMRGYNIFIAEPFTASQIDPGFRQLIFQSTKRDDNDGTVSLQDGIGVTGDLSCVTGTSESIISSMEEYRNDQLHNTVIGREWSLGPEMDVNVGVNAGPVNVGISRKIEPFIQDHKTNSKRLTQLEKFFVNQRGVLVKLEATCLNSHITLARYHLPEFQLGFKASVQKLYNTVHFSRHQRLEEFKKFIKDFGSHYSSETFLGARLIHNRRYTEQEQKLLKSDGMVDCSKQETKISAFATLRIPSDACRQVTKENTTHHSTSFVREETITFGSRPSTKTADWSAQDLTNQVPIRQRLVPIWKLFEQHSLSRIHPSMSELVFLSWLRPLYDDICNIMGYNCQVGDVCGIPGVNYACYSNQRCTRLYFPERWGKQYFCEDSRPMVYWPKTAV